MAFQSKNAENIKSQVEEFFEDSHGVFWSLDSMTDCSRVLVDLVVVSTLEALVSKEVNVLVVDSADLLLGFDVSETVCLVPPGWENIERNLATN